MENSKSFLLKSQGNWRAYSLGKIMVARTVGSQQAVTRDLGLDGKEAGFWTSTLLWRKAKRRTFNIRTSRCECDSYMDQRTKKVTFHQSIQIYMEQLEQWILFELHTPVVIKLRKH